MFKRSSFAFGASNKGLGFVGEGVLAGGLKSEKEESNSMVMKEKHEVEGLKSEEEEADLMVL